MSTYLQLRDRAISQISLTGNADAQEVAQIALQECMRYVAHKVRVPALLPTVAAAAPAPGGDGVIAMTLTGTFALGSGVYQAPDRLWVAKTSGDVTALDKGTPYKYYPIEAYRDLSNIAPNFRTYIDSDSINDLDSKFRWTVDEATGTVYIDPVEEGNYVTLQYHKSPAAYADGTTPEILPLFDYILVDGAVLALKEWLREPGEILTYRSLFRALDPDIEEYKRHIAGTRKRTQLRMHRSYRTMRNSYGYPTEGY